MMQIPVLMTGLRAIMTNSRSLGAQTSRRGEDQAGEELLCGYDLTGRFSFFNLRYATS